MSALPLPNLSEPVWLTAALRAAGVLPQGEVISVAIRDNPAFNSQVRHLTLRYTADAPTELPQALLRCLTQVQVICSHSNDLIIRGATMTSDVQVITDVRQVTPEWLTHSLQSIGALDDAIVTAITFEPPGTTSFSAVTRIHVTYSHTTLASTSFFLKYSQPIRAVVTPETGWEVRFYQSIAPLLSHHPLVRCYSAAFSAQEQKIHLLLEDITETHYPEIPSHLPPPYTTCEMIIFALAQLHTRFWDRPPFQVSGQSVLTDTDSDHRVQALTQRTNAFITMLGDRLSPERRTIYHEVLGSLPMLFRRLMTTRAMSIVHDDIHIGNFLYPQYPLHNRWALGDACVNVW